MSLLEQIQDDVKAAMKAGERERVHALRLIVNELRRPPRRTAADEVEVLQRERKRRLEAAEAYREGGRADLAEAEEREAEIIGSYMPEQISDDGAVGDRGRRGRRVRRQLAQGDGPGDGAGDAAGEGPRGRQARERRREGEAFAS